MLALLGGCLLILIAWAITLYLEGQGYKASQQDHSRSKATKVKPLLQPHHRRRKSGKVQRENKKTRRTYAFYRQSSRLYLKTKAAISIQHFWQKRKEVLRCQRVVAMRQRLRVLSACVIQRFWRFQNVVKTIQKRIYKKRNWKIALRALTDFRLKHLQYQALRLFFFKLRALEQDVERNGTELYPVWKVFSAVRIIEGAWKRSKLQNSSRRIAKASLTSKKHLWHQLQMINSSFVCDKLGFLQVFGAEARRRNSAALLIQAGWLRSRAGPDILRKRWDLVLHAAALALRYATISWYSDILLSDTKANFAILRQELRELKARRNSEVEQPLVVRRNSEILVSSTA